jgi:hypothetical protein
MHPLHTAKCAEKFISINGNATKISSHCANAVFSLEIQALFYDVVTLPTNQFAYICCIAMVIGYGHPSRSEAINEIAE